MALKVNEGIFVWCFIVCSNVWIHMYVWQAFGCLYADKIWHVETFCQMKPGLCVLKKFPQQNPYQNFRSLA